MQPKGSIRPKGRSEESKLTAIFQPVETALQPRRGDEMRWDEQTEAQTPATHSRVPSSEGSARKNNCRPRDQPAQRWESQSRVGMRLLSRFSKDEVICRANATNDLRLFFVARNGVHYISDPFFAYLAAVSRPCGRTDRGVATLPFQIDTDQSIDRRWSIDWF